MKHRPHLRDVNRDDVPYAMKGYYPRPKRPGPNDPIAIKGQFIGSRAEKIVVWVVLLAALLTVLVVGMYWLAKL